MNNPAPRRDEWISISIEALRGWIVFCVITAVSVIGFFGWRMWEQYSVEREAESVVEEARGLLQRVDRQQEGDINLYRERREDARDTLGRARESLAASEFDGAVQQGRVAIDLLSSILNELQDQGLMGDAHFFNVTGTVEFRRGESGDWEEARTRVSLRDGYYVRTSGGGSAEVMFSDGTLYRVRPNTLVQINRGRSAGEGKTIQMQYGSLDLSTAQRASRVQTPGASAQVQQSSSATVSYDEGSRRGRFAAYSGGLTVRSGQSSREVTAMQEVNQSGEQLSEPKRLPRSPDLASPRDNYEVELQPDGRLVLSWEPVYGARRYVLQVSRQRLFADNIIEDNERTTPRATLGLRNEGSFLWRVAAVDASGSRGPWSAVRKFRVTSETGRRGEDTEPPELVISSTQQYGSIYIIEGRTEPGAELTVRGEVTQVNADGSFQSTLQLFDEGWNFVEIRAKDSYGNETVRPVRLYVDSI